MPISNIDISQVVPSAANLNQSEPTLKEDDGVLLVANGRSEHPLQNEHCKPCLTVFQELQAKAVEGGSESQDLLKRAQAQMEQLQSNQINKLSEESKTPVPYASPENQEASSVSLTSGARLRAANIARLRPNPEVIAAANQKLVESRSRPDSGTSSGLPANGNENGGLRPEVVKPLTRSQLLKAGRGAQEPPKQTPPNAGSGPQAAAGQPPPPPPNAGSRPQAAAGQPPPPPPNAGSRPQAAAGQPPPSHGAGDESGHTEDTDAQTGKPASKANDAVLTDAELDEIRKLKQRDTEVRTHEQAHKSAAGSHGGSISLSFKQGPDGRRYAVEGAVPVDLSAISDDPKATVAKMQQIARAALAPAEPSSADRRVAAKAGQKAAKARKEIAETSKKEDNPLKQQHGGNEGGEIHVTPDPNASSQAAKELEGSAANESQSSVTDAQTQGASRAGSKPNHTQPVSPERQTKDQSPDGNRPERTALSRKMPLNAYAKAGAAQYGGGDQAERATLSMNVYG